MSHKQRLRWLRKLNSRGVDAVILPSFEVPPALGVGFAWHFADQVMRAYNASKPQRDQETPDLAQLFSDTVEAISTDQELIGLIGKEMVHEFLLVGNPGLSLCPP